MSLDIDVRKLRELFRPTVNPDGTVDLQGADFSSIDTYLRCGEQYYRRYIRGQISPPGLSLVEGTAHHKAMEADNKSKLEKDKAMKAKQLTEIFEASFKKELATAEKQCDEAKVRFDWECEDEEIVVSRAKPLHVHYEKDFSAGITPTAVEDTFSKEVSVPLPTPAGLEDIKFRLTGQTDVEDADGIFDYKTSSRAKSDKDLASSLQLTGYSWAKQKKKVRYIAFVKTKTPYVQRLDGTRDMGQWMWGLRVFAWAIRGIRKGIFLPTNPGAFPPPWWCSPDYCGYWGLCRGSFETIKTDR